MAFPQRHQDYEVSKISKKILEKYDYFNEVTMDAAWSSETLIRGCIQKFPDWVDDEIYGYNNKHSLRNNTKGYGGKSHYTDSQNSATTASRDRELYHFQFSLQAASPETFGYTLIYYHTTTRCRNPQDNEMNFITYLRRTVYGLECVTVLGCLNNGIVGSNLGSEFYVFLCCPFKEDFYNGHTTHPQSPGTKVTFKIIRRRVYPKVSGLSR
jgi:hypothetical protein